jgi:hypothetical protein
MPRSKCFNPFQVHNSYSRNKAARVTSVNIALRKKAESIGIAVLTKASICGKCRIRIDKLCLRNVSSTITATGATAVSANTIEVFTTQSDSDSSEEICPDSVQQPLSPEHNMIAINAESRSQSLQSLNDSLINVGCSPVKRSELRSSVQSSRKFQNVCTALGASIFNLSIEDEEDSNTNSDCEMIADLKTKFRNATSSQEKYLVLTSLPRSWSVSKIMAEFNVSRYMADKSKKLVAQNGYISMPSQKLGKLLDDHTIRAVVDFYRSDETSRVFPGKRNCVTVNEHGEKVAKRRRLLLFNLREGYKFFKEQFPSIKIGFSKFASLKPKECVSTSSCYGTHSVCVCMYHQNVKLLFEPLKKLNSFDANIETYKNLQAIGLCNGPLESCFLNECDHCPVHQALVDYLYLKFRDIICEEYRFKQWIINGGM